MSQSFYAPFPPDGCCCALCTAVRRNYIGSPWSSLRIEPVADYRKEEYTPFVPVDRTKPTNAMKSGACLTVKKGLKLLPFMEPVEDEL